jgi:pimeloyl-ACP methyl ester carboxylesterase
MKTLGLSYLYAAALSAFCSPVLALDETACRLEADGLPAAFAQCATLTVPEDYAAPEGASLELYVARMPAASANPRPDPLLLISGGPGQSAVDFYLQSRAAFEPVRRDRDILLLDQRGTGRSAAGLQCELPEGMELETAGSDLLDRVIAACLTELGNDPGAFTTSVAVRDLERLRIELDLAQWNVYGISYGTRVAQHYLRRYPEATRAVILDGVVPAAMTLGPDIAPNAQAALAAIWQRCASSAPCADKFGDLPAKFTSVQEQLGSGTLIVDGADPVSGEALQMRFGEDEFRAVVRLMSYSAQTAALLPLVMNEAYAGNYRPLAGQAQIVVQGLSESLSFAMHNSVVCTEDAPFFTPDSAASGAGTYLGNSVFGALETICTRWPRGVLDEDFKTAVASDRPVLLLSGETDPVTPPAYAEMAVAGGLVNSVHLIGIAQGHGMAAVACVPRLMRSFLNDPEPSQLKADCLADEPPTPFFLTFQGPAP